MVKKSLVGHSGYKKNKKYEKKVPVYSKKKTKPVIKKNARGKQYFKKIIWLENLKNIPHYVAGRVNNFYNCLD